MKELEGLRIRQRSVERLGCIKGCLEYLGSDVSFPWLYGGTGHAFIISLDPGVDVSSPDSWDHQRQYDLGRNLGYAIHGVSAWKPDAATVDVGDAFAAKQREAWDFVRANIDAGVPCFGFELKAYYGGYWVIYGYDDTGYYYSGWEEGGPLPWEKLGDQFIPLLEVRSVQRCPAAPDDQVVCDGLAFALKHAENPPSLIDPGAKSGPAAWAYWAEALQSGEAKRDHHTYNLQLWLECREAGIAFLQEAKARLARTLPTRSAGPTRSVGGAFDAAAAQYALVCDKLKELLALHPEREKPDWGPESTFTSAEAAALVRQAGEADALGIDALGIIHDRL